VLSKLSDEDWRALIAIFRFRGARCSLRQLFNEADELVRYTYASVSLATLAKRTRGARR